MPVGKRLFVLHVAVAVILATALTLGLTVTAGAAYPDREITLVVQAAPGGVSDFVARTTANAAAPILGGRISVVNRTGGAGAVGMGTVAAARPDGYTIGYVPVELSMLKHLGYADIYPDRFTLIMRANIIPAALTVRADSPYKTLDDFIKAAKARPGQIAVGNSGPGSIWHLAAAAFEDAAQVSLKHVPFDGAAPAVAALLGGNLEAVTVSPSEVLGNVQAGKLRILAVMGENRSLAVPDIPTFRELGLDLVVMAWGGFALPKGTPQEIVDKVHEAFKQAYDTPEYRKAFIDRGIEPGYLGPEEFARFAQSQYEMFGRLFTRLGLAK